MRFVHSVALLLGGLGGVAAFGQMNTGELSGSVQDASKGLFPGAMIVAQHLETGQKFTSSANNSGEYLLPQLPVGIYSLTVSAADFKQSVLPRVEIHASARLRRDFTLEVGNRTDVVTVRADDGNVQLASAEIRDVIAHQQVVDLPVKNRQFLDLAMLIPGVVRPPGGTRGDALQQAGSLVNVLGQRDLSLQKDIRLKEALTLQFRAEAYNLFNHPNFNVPNRIAFTANFGSISSAQDSRQLQLALKLAF